MLVLVLENFDYDYEHEHEHEHDGLLANSRAFGKIMQIPK